MPVNNLTEKERQKSRSFPQLFKVGLDGKMHVYFHRGQHKVWEDKSPIVGFSGGKGAGKSSFIPHWMHREMMEHGPGDYLIASTSQAALELLTATTFQFFNHLKIGTMSQKFNRFLVSPLGARALGWDALGEIHFRVIRPNHIFKHPYRAIALDDCGELTFREEKVREWESDINTGFLRRLLLCGRVLGYGWWHEWSKKYAYRISTHANPGVHIPMMDLPKWYLDMYFRSELADDAPIRQFGTIEEFISSGFKTNRKRLAGISKCNNQYHIVYGENEHGMLYIRDTVTCNNIDEIVLAHKKLRWEDLYCTWTAPEFDATPWVTHKKSLYEEYENEFLSKFISEKRIFFERDASEILEEKKEPKRSETFPDDKFWKLKEEVSLYQHQYTSTADVMPFRVETGPLPYFTALRNLSISMNNKPIEININNENRLFEWARKYVPDVFKHRPSIFHEWISSQLSIFPFMRGRKLNVIAPRGAAKSTWVELACLYFALNKTERFIAYLSDTEGQAEGHINNIQKFIHSSPKLQEHYHSQLKGSWFNKGEIEINGCRILCGSRGTKIRGERHGVDRFSLIILDDVQSIKDIISKTHRDHAITWMDQEVFPAGDESTNVISIGTAIHHDGVVNVLGRRADWTHQLFRALELPVRMDLWGEFEKYLFDYTLKDRMEAARKFYYDNESEMLIGAKSLWPDRQDFSVLNLMLKRANNGHKAFEAEYQGNPVNLKACEWPSEYFEGGDIFFREWPKDLYMKVVALDPSKGIEKKGDWSAFTCLGFAQDGKIYADVRMYRLPTTELVQQGFELIREFERETGGPIDAFGCETEVFQSLLLKEYERKLHEMGRVINTYGIPTKNVPKVIRIRRLTPYLAKRMLSFRLTKDMEECLRQMVEFPQGDYDDGPDSIEMAIRLASMIREGKNQE